MSSKDDRKFVNELNHRFEQVGKLLDDVNFIALAKGNPQQARLAVGKLRKLQLQVYDQAERLSASADELTIPKAYRSDSTEQESNDD